MRPGDVLDLETVALARPQLAAHPPDVFSGQPVELAVVSHTEVTGGFALTLEPEVGEAVRIDYRIGQSERLPIEVGERLSFRLPLDSRQEPVGLVVRDEDQTLRALVVLGEDLSSLPEASGLGISPDFSPGSIIYSEAIAVLSCLVRLDHHSLRVSDGRERVNVRPGTSRVIDIADARTSPRVTLTSADDALPFALLVLDVSRPGGETDGRCPQRAHVSWALMRID